VKRYIAGLLMLTGVAVLAAIGLPILFSQLGLTNYEPGTLIDPTVLAASTDSNYTSPGSWFDTSKAPHLGPVSTTVFYYTLSMPRVGIKDAVIEINGENLAKNAIQYPGTAVPGTYGNTVIFGHSTLPQLYKPNDAISIFNPVVKTKVGDEIAINYDGVTYRYIVRATAIVKPTEIDVLAQQYDRHFLTLITCTPLGTYINRFIVRAELVN
jgi:sortase A